ncbi:MAG: glycosyltransferase [bacterium]|nr:glycosyltransferase [bacterium]
MKILCVIPSYYPAFKFGGPIASVHNLNKALVKKGADVTVYTTNIGLAGKVTTGQEINVDGVKVIYFNFSKIFEFVGPNGWQFSRPLTRALKKNVNNFDLVYLSAVWNYPTAVAAHYCRKYGKPYIIAPRGTLYSYTFNKKGWKKRLYYELIAKKDLESAASIHYTARDEFEKTNSFLKLKNKKAFVVPNGIDLSEFVNLPLKSDLVNSYPILKNKKVILFLSRLNWKKGLDILAKAYGLVVQKRDDVHLLIVGDGEESFKAKVKKWFEDEKVMDKLTFAGMLTGRKKLEAYVGSDIFALPSYSENFGMAVVEAMACGLPTIISDGVGIHREISNNRAGIVAPCNPIQLAEAIDNLLNNKMLRQNIKENAQRLIREKFDIDKVADEMIGEYKKIIIN